MSITRRVQIELNRLTVVIIGGGSGRLIRATPTISVVCIRLAMRAASVRAAPTVLRLASAFNLISGISGGRVPPICQINIENKKEVIFSECSKE